MENKTVKTPKYWMTKPFQPLMEAETVNGHKVKIPRQYSDAWKVIRMVHEEMTERGLDVLDGLETDKETNELFYDAERVFYEIYEEDD